MKFKVHLFREYRETYEVEADNADAALNLVDEDPPAPIQTEMLEWTIHRPCMHRIRDWLRRQA